MFSKKHSSYAWPFYKPVDADQLGLTDYHDIIKHPMDLGTVKAKMDSRQYSTAAEFASDVRRIFQNCFEYNPETHDVCIMARKLKQVFEDRFENCPSEGPPSIKDSFDPPPLQIKSPPLNHVQPAVNRPVSRPRAAAGGGKRPIKKEEMDDSDSDDASQVNVDVIKDDWNRRLMQVGFIVHRKIWLALNVCVC